MSISITPTTFKHGKEWAYTVTYDEALTELFDHVVPLHEELGLPGHVEVVVGQMGEVRRVGNSSYNGYHHMGADRLRELIDMGWGVGNHSWTHGIVEENIDLEVRQAKEVLEDAIGHRVTVYTAPGSNANITPKITAALQEHGYLCALSVTDDINRPDADLWFLNRVANLHQAWTPLFAAFDSHHRLTQAQRESGWVIDYCHCPAPTIPHENKDLYIDEHRARLNAVIESGDKVWTATAEEILDYIVCRRHLQVESVSDAAGEESYRLRLQNLPSPVASRQVTVDIKVPPNLRRNPVVILNGQPQPGLLVKLDTLRVTLDLTQPITLSVGGSSQ
ncbi:MAG: polysaccharide deacetylase family protein [Caldilineaceae bacterium]|nr:polysaccharide deacetylase family protein [Caldilineaceae bacterium]